MQSLEHHGLWVVMLSWHLREMSRGVCPGDLPGRNFRGDVSGGIL